MNTSMLFMFFYEFSLNEIYILFFRDETGVIKGFGFERGFGLYCLQD
jgi:hypothetical protein